MPFGEFFAPRPSPYLMLTTNNTRTPGCTSWYGHAFRKFDATTIFCPTCGESKTVKK